MSDRELPRTEISYLLQGADKEVGLALFVAGREYGESRPEAEEFMFDWKPTERGDVVNFGRTALHAVTRAEMLHFSERTQSSIEQRLLDVAGEQYLKIAQRSRTGFILAGVALSSE